ncbi:MAG: type IV toxin-antitoxin system AbiEi family antitoxin domain-containing protein [Pseudonocardiaceae bacterium]
MPVDRRDLRRRLFAQASEQAGYFTAAQAKAIGYSYQAQAHHVGAGNWLRIDRGLFRLALRSAHGGGSVRMRFF